VAQAVELLPSKCQALSSSRSTPKRSKKEKAKSGKAFINSLILNVITLKRIIQILALYLNKFPRHGIFLPIYYYFTESCLGFLMIQKSKV
jgi:hypothetical protein